MSQKAIENIVDSFTVNKQKELLRQVETTADLCRRFGGIDGPSPAQLASEVKDAQEVAREVQSQFDIGRYEALQSVAHELGRTVGPPRIRMAAEAAKFSTDLTRVSAQVADAASQLDIEALQSNMISQRSDEFSELLAATASPRSSVEPAGTGSSGTMVEQRRDDFLDIRARDGSGQFEFIVDILVCCCPISREEATKILAVAVVEAAIVGTTSLIVKNVFLATLSASVATAITRRTLGLTGSGGPSAPGPGALEQVDEEE